ncbi:MAG: aminotransferase class III-fold pyridoxal phosphate-dependent enzyme, partial [Methyloprofundus sp.]|nr:aminotransferase class III-fold pyridoxal phosphate-dependent enzyme [Methyloprofundus sp.]
AALAVLKTIEDEDMCQQATDKGWAINTKLTTALKNNKHFVEARNKGMMIGIELNTPCTQLVLFALEAGLLINVTNNSTIRLLPPLILDDSQIDLLIDTLVTLIDQNIS